ncbi:MAG: hypothetical protein J6X33_08500 [Clostridiales bacterium]|nr:hypothetical protein [Clostridiales bacterium]
MWLVFIFIAVILSVINLIMSLIGRTRLRNWLTIGALSFTAFEAWAQYNMISQFLFYNDYVAINTTVPAMNDMIIWFIIILVLINILANVLYKSRAGKIGMAFEGREYHSRSTDAPAPDKNAQAKEEKKEEAKA